MGVTNAALQHNLASARAELARAVAFEIDEVGGHRVTVERIGLLWAVCCRGYRLCHDQKWRIPPEWAELEPMTLWATRADAEAAWHIERAKLEAAGLCR
jgi:hypothetical protein